MNVTFLIDDPVWSDNCFKHLLKEVRETEPWLGMGAYYGKYKGIDICVYVCNSCKESISLRAESLFDQKDMDLIFNLGYCYIWKEENSKITDGDLVLVSSTRCDDDYVNLFNLYDLSNRRVIDIDKKLEKRIVDASKHIAYSVRAISCYSSSEVNSIPRFPEGKMNCPCFDHKSFALYEMAQRYNRTVLCFYQARKTTSIDLHDYLLSKNGESATELSKLALDFVVRLYH